MNDQGNDGFRPRRIVETTQFSNNQHWKKKKKRHNASGVKYTTSNVMNRADSQEQQSVTEQFQVPMELRPLITAAMDYGKKTHALGMLKAAQALASIANRLRTLNELQSIPSAYKADIQRILDDAEAESAKMMSAFGATYNEG